MLLPVRRPDGDEHFVALAVDQEQRRLVARALQRRAQFVHRFHRLAVHRLDDVAGLDARVSGASVRIDVLNDEAVRIYEEGLRLYAECAKRLDAADLRITQLADALAKQARERGAI